MKSSALVPLAFAALAAAVKKTPVPDAFGFLFTHENYKGGRFLISDECTSIDREISIGSLWIPTIENHPIKCFLHDNEDCESGSLVVSYDASETDIPTKFGDQVAAIECLYFD
ncbi:hypothetical protein ACQKWADRAFT_300233, partial [Trichoderma austrokoningii]